MITAAGTVHPAMVEATKGQACLPSLRPHLAGRCYKSQTACPKRQRRSQGSLLDIFMDPGLSIQKKQLLLTARAMFPGKSPRSAGVTVLVPVLCCHTSNLGRIYGMRRLLPCASKLSPPGDHMIISSPYLDLQPV